MADIRKLRFPRCVPISYFQPISTTFENNLTFIESLEGMRKKLNELILQVNQNTELIVEIPELRNEVVALTTLINSTIENLPDLIDSTIEPRVIALRQDLNAQLALLNGRITSEANRLDNRIDNVAVGQISVFNPTAGEYQPLQEVINSLFEQGRDNALTATEYDGLELTATEYDGEELTAFDYDKNGKTLLTA